MVIIKNKPESEHQHVVAAVLVC